ncbi:CO dehydrogenase/acetyl-CoA synthase complex subunit alpha [Archaeoglobus veneficus]|uniref:Acetyl-CoA decarbonylase/synthase complex subunit alpha n=1 Tax=Archaeoglobus veneficus (strain DSM 11195 / SNP6) TaxID=693661 RepID=F2KTA1_ARCVS|nr:CO dehydrogenase/acetyl-CoA synthase complex subunit alpha [Archaeoglobus veneficus]AEA47131.1 Acetyl-CoA decarbonylase/synthase complex subunit alpha [Archaeoglobus veneficus SNP6]
MDLELREGIFVLDEMRNVSIKIGRIIDEEEEKEKEWEPLGPTPKPHILDLRHWDRRLLERYEPIYAPMQDFCNLCTMGPCELSQNKEGACGIDLKTQKARLVTLACLIGASSHTAHARHLVHYLIEKFGHDYPIDLGGDINVEAPNIRLVFGIKPKKLGDLEKVLDYVEQDLVRILHTTHTGQEEDHLDYESKAMHVGMLDHVAMEVADIAQVVAFNYPLGDPNAPLIDIGFGVLETEKPVILVIGHNILPARNIDDYLREHGLEDEVEIAGLCCTAIDTTRYDPKAKIVGTLSYELRAIRSGIPDVVVTDEQCIRADTLRECSKLGIPVIASSEAAARGLPDRTHENPDVIVNDLVSGRAKGVLIRDPDKVGEIAVRVAMEIRKKKGKKPPFMSEEELKTEIDRCTGCMNCVFACPHNLRIDKAMSAAKDGDFSVFKTVEDSCIACGRCEQVCPRDIRIVDVIMKASYDSLVRKTGKMRAGRGPIQDTEIRNVGQPIVMGTIPGIIAPIGCPNYPKARNEIVEIIEEFLKRKFIVVSSGCHAMDLGMYRDEDGKSLYEKYPGAFDAGCLTNVGSCVANSHISGAAIKVANIFAMRPLRANYAEIADYILNRVGAVGLAWGPYSQKAASIATGFNRLGVPAVVGPHAAKYRRAFIGKVWKKEDWWVYDIKSKQRMYVEPCPDALLVVAETKEEAIVQLARLCIRPADTYMGRQIKLTHYIELSKKYLGCLPDDWHLYVRTEADLPLKMKDELLKILEEEHGWKIDWSKKKILEGPIRPYDSGFNPTILEEVFEKYAR